MKNLENIQSVIWQTRVDKENQPVYSLRHAFDENNDPNKTLCGRFIADGSEYWAEFDSNTNQVECRQCLKKLRKIELIS